VALWRRGLEKGDERLEDAVGQAGADRVPFYEAFDVVCGLVRRVGRRVMGSSYIPMMSKLSGDL
jgi:hypothetical protein